MMRPFSVQALAAGVLAAFVGFASSFAVIVQGLVAVGATREQAASGLMALSIGMGVCAIWLSLRTRMPISVACPRRAVRCWPRPARSRADFLLQSGRFWSVAG